jgi:1-acyl-sn-glycerol-3-phosphate acyltransferase
MPDIDKVVVLGAPHTTNWDYPHMLAGAAYHRRRPNVTVKKELFVPPLGWVLRALGGIEIDRSGSYNVVDQLADAIKASDRFMMVFTPEGTRSYRDTWKTGFYYTALRSGATIVCATIDYEQKFVDFGLVFEPSGNIIADFDLIRDYYTSIGRALYPENVNKIDISERHKRRVRKRLAEEAKQGDAAATGTPDADTSADVKQTGQ